MARGSIDEGEHEGHDGGTSASVDLPDGPIIHDVIVVMELGRRVNR